MREGYKETSFGSVPNEWKVSKIEEIANVKGGKRLPKGESLIEEKTNHPYIRVADMFFGGVDLKKILYVPEHVYPSIKSYTIGKDDLFISVAGTLGIVGEVPRELDGANLTENADKLTNISINKSFLLQVLLSPIIQNAIQKEQTNNAQPKLALSRIRTFEVPNPPLPEQQKIAEILSTVDAKIEVIDQQITETQALKKGLMQRLLTKGIVHTEFKDSPLGEIPKSWEIVKLEEIGDFFKGKGISKSEILKKGLFPCLRYGEIYTIYDTIIYNFQSFINEESANNSIVFKSGDLLFTGSGETAEDIGKCVTYIGSETPYASGDLIIHRPIKGDSRFLSYYMNSSIIRNQTKKMGQGNAVVHIYTKHLSQLTFTFPPVEEQTQIAEILSSVDDKLEVLNEKKTHYQELKQGLMQKLLTGKVRVNTNENITA